MGIFVNRITRQLSFLVAVSCLNPIAAGLLAQALPPPELITDRQGLPQAYVPDIVQDQQGFIWAATRDGLCRFDGQRFKVFQPSPNGKPSLSYTGISRLKQDHRGRIWVFSERHDIDIFNPKTETVINFSRLPVYKRRMAGTIATAVCIDRQDQLWVVASNQFDVFRFDPGGHQSAHFAFAATTPATSPANVIFDMTVTADGRVWLATRQGLFLVDERTHTLKPYRWSNVNPALMGSPSANPGPLFQLFARPDSKGADAEELLLFSENQVTRFQPRTGTTRSYPLPAGKPDWIQVNCTADSRGNVYFIQDRSLMRFTNQTGVERMVSYQTEPPQSQGTRLWVDQSDVLWEGTKGAGIRKYDLKAMPFRAIGYQQSFHNDLLKKPWLAIPPDQWLPLNTRHWPTSYDFRYTLDRQGKLWYNTGTSLIAQIDLKTRQISQKPLPVAFQNQEFGDPPCPLATDPQGQVWAIRDSLIWRYDSQQARWQAWPHPISRQRTKTWVVLFTIDESAFWLATEQHGLWRMDRRTGQLRQYANKPNDPTSLSNNAIFAFSSDPQDPNRLWIGTFGGGLCAFDKRTGRCRRITVANGLPNNVIYSVIPDRLGYLWMGTNKGICRMNRKTGQTLTFTREDGLLADEFNRFHYLHLADDRILMGGLEGITAFYPNQFSQDTYEPAVELTALLINNQPVDSLRTESSAGNRNYQPIQATQELTFAHDQNYLTAEFAVMQFNRSAKNKYRYRLEGLDEQWTPTDRPVAVYTALLPGHYTLWLNASNTSGRWSRHVRKLALIIKPPFWATWWAYGLYGLGTIGLVIILVRAYANRVRLRQSLALQQREIALSQHEADQLRQVNQMKSNFFANITHEFRTPLTLILGPTEQMVSEEPTPKNHRRLLTIEQNAHQLLRLINQLLDLSRLEASVMPVHESPGDLTDSVAYWLQPLAEQAAAQGLTLTFTSEVVGAYWFDAEKLERIVYNLTANALKFTPTGSIHVTLTHAAESLCLTVADTGRGIPAEHLPHIFDRFYQVSPSTDSSEPTSPQQAQQPGTGIGLALVKELVGVQGGTISVDSVLNEGTTFVVRLPYRQVSHGTAAQDVIDSANFLEQAADAVTVDVPGTESGDRPHILIVEDNNELAHFIAESLPPIYRTRRAVDGRDGLEQALDQQPDLIISDVMMPRMDGFALCGQLKTDLRTSHIPVILLTAKASTENRLEGLSLGADDYLTKPFNGQELQLRVRNQLDSQRRQRDWVRASLSDPGPAATPSVSAPPDPFLTQIYDLIESRLDDTTFGVEQMTTELGLSRTSLFRKVKSLTDLSTNELIRNYRLKRAVQLLRDGHAITETAYRVGFDSPAYFSKCFRDLYQLTPREFVAQA